MERYNNFKQGDYVEGIEEIHMPLEDKPMLKIMRGWLNNINTNFNTAYIRADDCYNGARGTVLKLDTIHLIDKRIEKWWTLKKNKTYFSLIEKLKDKRYKLSILSYAGFMDYINHISVEINTNELIDYINYFNLNIIDLDDIKISQLGVAIKEVYALKYSEQELSNYIQEINSITDYIINILNIEKS